MAVFDREGVFILKIDRMLYGFYYFTSCPVGLLCLNWRSSAAAHVKNRTLRKHSAAARCAAPGTLLTPHTHCTRPSTDLIDFTLWVRPSSRLRLLPPKVEKSSTFSGSDGCDGSVTQSDRVMQIYPLWRYLDSAQWKSPLWYNPGKHMDMSKYQSASGRLKNLKTTPPCVGHAHSLPSTDVYSGYAAWDVPQRARWKCFHWLEWQRSAAVTAPQP